MSARWQRRLPAVVMIVIGVLFLVPFAWLVASAFERHGTLQLTAGGGFTVGHFADVLHGGFLTALGNSLYLAGGTMICTTVIGVLAAYPLSRFRSRAGSYFVYLLVFLTGLPIIAIIIPAYDFFVTANFINSKFWTVWFMTATALPFGTFLAPGAIVALLAGSRLLATYWHLFS